MTRTLVTLLAAFSISSIALASDKAAHHEAAHHETTSTGKVKSYDAVKHQLVVIVGEKEVTLDTTHSTVPGTLKEGSTVSVTHHDHEASTIVVK